MSEIPFSLHFLSFFSLKPKLFSMWHADSGAVTRADSDTCPVTEVKVKLTENGNEYHINAAPFGCNAFVS